MNENYLWDKTGSDAEIEQMEKALAGFRSKQTMPPALPAKVIPFREKTSRQSLRFVYAVAACAAFVMIGLSLWFQLSVDKTATQESLAETIQPQIKQIVAKDTPGEKSAPGVEQANASGTRLKTSKQTSAPRAAKTNKFLPVAFRQTEKKAVKVETKKRDVQLTKEEQYAYDQLMLALSITSSKLKMVKDKVEGLEE